VNFSRSLERLDEYVRVHDYAGPDPYDGLSSPIARIARGRRARQAVVQAVKRSPVDVRRWIGIRPVRMTKALALFATGLHAAPHLPDAATRREHLLSEILRRARSGGWGYEFDVQTRWGFYPAGSPNIIVTAFAIEALAASERAVPTEVADWLYAEMWHGDFIRYVPGNDSLVHNANVLGACAWWRAGGPIDAIRTAVLTTVGHQRPDGTWPYGESQGLEWVDNFHTAYVLLALHELQGVVPEASDALRRGTQAWLDRCFASDGAPYYYADRAGPVDIHNIATAVRALQRITTEPEAAQVRAGAMRALLSRQRPDGAFVSAPGKPAYMRWNQGHAYVALAEADGA
jgi:hypothetical protein